jgi:hypothetical protein
MQARKGRQDYSDQVSDFRSEHEVNLRPKRYLENRWTVNTPMIGKTRLATNMEKITPLLLWELGSAREARKTTVKGRVMLWRLSRAEKHHLLVLSITRCYVLHADRYD